MSKYISLDCFDIQLFAEGGAGAGGGTGTVGATGVSAADAGQQSTGAGNPLAGVKYGKQADAAGDAQGAAGETVAGDGPEQARARQFKALIKGEYKDLYDAEVNDVVRRRFKATDEKVSRYDALSPTLELLCRKYGVENGDVEALGKAIEDDDSFFEEEAMQRGMSVQQLKQVRKMERENADLKRQMQERQTQEQADKLYSTWLNQAEEAKRIYPDFDLAAELQNADFQSLLRSNIPVQTAYEVVHKDEIITRGMNFAAKTVEKKIANDMIARGRRPSEGAMSQGAAVIKSDVSQLTKADRREIARRVARGEKIVF